MKKLLKKWGFYYIRSITEEDIWELTSDFLSDYFAEDFPKEERQRLMTQLQNVEGYKEFLTYLSVSDIRRFFQASTPQQQLEARGAYARAIYLKSLLVPAKEKQVSTKLPGKRYGG